jgi:hypothetical protein
MFRTLILIILKELCEMFSLSQISKKCDLNWFSHEIDFYTLLQHISIHLILMLISISDLNAIMLKILKKFLNQKTEIESDTIYSDNSESIYILKFQLYF